MVIMDRDSTVSLNWLADPGCEIPESASVIHGITTEHARTHGDPHDQVVTEIIETLHQYGWGSRRAVVVFNAAYDLTILARLSTEFHIAGPVIDPFVIDREKDKYRKGKRTLGAACEHYGVPLDNAHNAEADADAAGRLATVLLKDDPSLLEQHWMRTNALQARWHADRQKSYADYLISQGKSASSVNGEWPVQVSALVQSDTSENSDNVSPPTERAELTHASFCPPAQSSTPPW